MQVRLCGSCWVCAFGGGGCSLCVRFTSTDLILYGSGGCSACERHSIPQGSSAKICFLGRSAPSLQVCDRALAIAQSEMLGRDLLGSYQ